MGWTELLRSTAADKETIGITMELEEDIRRLQHVADRFNKIGSTPELKPHRCRTGFWFRVIDYYGEAIAKNRQRGSAVRRDIRSDIKIGPESGSFFHGRWKT